MRDMAGIDPVWLRPWRVWTGQGDGMISRVAFAGAGFTAAIRLLLALAFVLVFWVGASPGHAQVARIDPNAAIANAPIDGDLSPSEELPPVSESQDADPYRGSPLPSPSAPDAYVLPTAPTRYPPAEQVVAPPADTAQTVTPTDASTTYRSDDLIGAAQGVFGEGAEGLARLIEDILRKQGNPNAYIVGREAGGALGIGVRYGSGTMYHKVEGKSPVYWTGPSIGFDAGANAGSTFVLVYNLWDSEELYERYPAGEGAAYLVGGFNASYMRKGDVVLIPIRLGVGARLGVNAGYIKFSKEQRWLPF